MILHDEGAGVTEDSLAYFRRNAAKLGRILAINIDFNREFSMEILGVNGIMLLSGCTCGYRGTGPHGSVEILTSLGAPEHFKEQVFALEHVRINLRDEHIFLVRKPGKRR